MRSLRRRVHGAGLCVGRVRAARAAGGGVPPRLQDARHRSARRGRTVELPAGRHPSLADRPRRRRRDGLRRRDLRAHRRISGDRQLQPARRPVRDRGHRRRVGGTGGGGRAASRDQRRQAVVHSGARHRRAVPLVGAAGRRGRLPPRPRAGHAARRRPRTADRALHPQPGAAAVHPRPRLHPGGPGPGAGRAARRNPGRLRHLAQRAARGSVSQARHRAAGLAVRQPGALDRNPGSAVHRGGGGRSRRRALRRDRRQERADRRGSGDQHAQAAGVLAQHHRGAQRRA